MADIFALRDSDLNAFLFAEVGTESNGSKLTTLSMLARLGLDPWIEAATWAKAPKDEVIASLVTNISRMPLSQQALSAARSTALRLADLLPSEPVARILHAAPHRGLHAVPRGAWLVVGYVLICLIIGLGMSSALYPADPVIAPLQQSSMPRHFDVPGSDVPQVRGPSGPKPTE